MKNKSLIIIGIIVAILIITNPSPRTASNYITGSIYKTEEDFNIKREYNFFILSIYVDYIPGRTFYLGILGNMFYIKYDKEFG